MQFLTRYLGKLPVQKGELPKFCLTSIMMMAVIYIYSVLRGSKDAMMVSFVGAEAISAIKLFGVMPYAVLFMFLYTKLVDVFTRINLFHLINWFFCLFFFVFAFLIFPNKEALHINMERWVEALPSMRHIFHIIGDWHYSLYFIFSELWGSIMLSLLFWQLANQITTTDQAKRFYPLFGLMAQIGLIGAGVLLHSISFKGGGSSLAAKDPIAIAKSWQSSLYYISISIVLGCAVLSYCMQLLSKIVSADLINGVISLRKEQKKKKDKKGFMESIRYILSSKYIGLIALLILCYGISINLVEGLWKKALNIRFPDPGEYAGYMGMVQIYTGIATASCMLFSSWLLTRIKWRSAALLTPIMIFFTGVLFYLFILFRTELDSTVIALGATAIGLAAFFGSAQNILAKGVKYSFFDPTKEMSYIPLDEDLKTKGKAAADVVGGRLGKSAGAFVQAGLLMLMPASDLLDLAPVTFGVFFIILLTWLWAAFGLSKQYEEKIKDFEQHQTSNKVATS